MRAFALPAIVALALHTAPRQTPEPFGQGALPFGSLNMPELSCTIEPDYTDEARAANVEGVVVIEVVVLKGTAIGDARVLTSIDDKYGLDAAALKAVRACTVTRRESGAPRPPDAYIMRVPFVFRLHRPGRLDGDTSGQSEADRAFAGDAYDIRSRGLTAPKVKFSVEPKYTGDALRAKLEGDVMVEAVVGADGRVRASRVLVGLKPDHGLNDEALVAVRGWRFTPAQLGGKAVAVVVAVDMMFRLH